MELELQNYQNRHPLGNKVLRCVWHCVWLTLFRPTPRANLFRPWRIFLLKCFGARISWRSNVLPSCRIWQPWKLEMGAYACLSERVECYNVSNISIGEQATVSQGTFLCTASHDISSPIMELTTAPIVIENQAWVAAEAFVGMGVTVGEGAVVGARAAVFKDVEPWTVVGVQIFYNGLLFA